MFQKKILKQVLNIRKDLTKLSMGVLVIHWSKQVVLQLESMPVIQSIVVEK